MKRNRVLSGLAGAALLVVAAWLGIDLSKDQDTADSHPAATTTASSRGASAAPDASSAAHAMNRTGLPVCPADTLPEEADEVIEDILSGGPFDHPGFDGKHFGNYERVLPRERNSFYREYTVDTPGVGHRGERRIVVGGGSEQDPDTWYYTEDHYESFCVIPDAEE